MSVSEHENCKSRSQGPTNTSLFQKASHPESVLSQLDNLRRQSLFTDVTLRAGSRSFPCHRAVLAACSRYFEAMFSSGLRESRAGEVDFGESVQPEALEQLLEYAYTSRLALSGENAESLLQAGDMLQLHDVRQAAADFLERSLGADNCLRLMLLADAHQCRRLYQQAWGMCLAHFQTYAEGGLDGDDDDFCGLPEAKLGELLACDELDADDERLVHRALMRWVRHDATARRHCLPRLLSHVRLGLLPAGYLERAVARDGLVAADERSLRLVAEARRCLLLPTSPSHKEGACSPCARPRRAGHTLLILGGRTFMCDKIYELERRARRIVPRAALPSPRKEFSACALGAKVYVSGGRGSETGVSRDVWVFDTAAGGWARAAPMLLARFGHGSAELLGSLYAVGGHTSAVSTGEGGGHPASRSVERYEPQADSWHMAAPLLDGVSNAAVVSARRRLYVIGGAGPWRGHEREQERAPSVQCYNPDDDHWAVVAACPQAWRYTAAAAVLGSQIFIMGGDTEFTAASAYRFDCDTNEWSRLGDMSAKRMSCHAVASGNKLYVVGGYFGTQRCKSLDCYDPASDTWSSITTVPYSLIPTAFVSTWKHRDLLDTD
ncbi:kelch-like protein 25 [Leucoraja erinacea]|uniref:kelch-like protein 25 n=1 Tax=Leucoraja erinaceus TaxID=7782 RepID=UPI00245720E3|nr:kelch-like protein 25 [Leucoraja erinacea]